MVCLAASLRCPSFRCLLLAVFDRNLRVVHPETQRQTPQNGSFVQRTRLAIGQYYPAVHAPEQTPEPTIRDAHATC